MTIVNELQRIENNIKASYTALAEKGAELPTKQNSDNLASTIANLEVGASSEWEEAVFSTGTPTKLEIPNKYKKVRDYAFYYASSTPTWENNLEEIEGLEVEEIGEKAFYNQSEIKKINLPKVTRIGEGGLYNATSKVAEFVRLGALEYVGASGLYNVFSNENCDYSVTFAKGCELGNNALYGWAINSFDFTGFKSIGGRVWGNNPVKMKVWIPKTVETINATSSAFSLFGANRGHLIFTDVADEASVPEGWGKYWNNFSTTKLTVNYGATYEDFLNAEV